MTRGEIHERRSGPAVRRALAIPALAALAALVGLAVPAVSQQVDVPTIRPLTGELPLLPDTSGFVVDKVAAQQLGKALFWDINGGSDGQACASCHFAAGADLRLPNQVNPGHDKAFDARRNPANGKTGPNKTLSAADFPFRQLADMNNRNSGVLYDINDRFSSQGSFGGDFVSSRRWGFRVGLGADRCSSTYDPANNPFHANGLIFRKVEPRQTPTNINAVFNVRQFWDGRANNVFNGVDPFGMRTNNASPAAGILVKQNDGSVALQKLAMINASLASQSVGPPLSSFEMSCAGKSFADLARKLLALAPLASQKVSTADSRFSLTPGLVPSVANGLNSRYETLVKKAFAPQYWSDTRYFKISDAGQVVPATSVDGFRQVELNFALFWGLAMQEYQALLISDRTPYDNSQLTTDQAAGRALFVGKGKCVNCHSGALFSNAAVTRNDVNNPVERMVMGDAGTALYDRGYYNIGVTPTSEDAGLGGTDPYGNPLSFSRQWVAGTLNGIANGAPDPFNVDPCQFDVPFDAGNCASVPTGTTPRDAVDGAFKTPILRNVGVNPPYMHDGSLATLKQVVQFYNRGGNRVPMGAGDTTGSAAAASNLDADIVNLNLTDAEMNSIVNFMTSLTDQRVACHQAPFDHPALPLTMGNQNVASSSISAQAKDVLATLPAVGSTGLPGIRKPCFANSGDLFAAQTAFRSILGLP